VERKDCVRRWQRIKERREGREIVIRRRNKNDIFVNYHAGCPGVFNFGTALS
jgi:hypothetical protein